MARVERIIMQADTGGHTRPNRFMSAPEPEGVPQRGRRRMRSPPPPPLSSSSSSSSTMIEGMMLAASPPTRRDCSATLRGRPRNRSPSSSSSTSRSSESPCTSPLLGTSSHFDDCYAYPPPSCLRRTPRDATGVESMPRHHHYSAAVVEDRPPRGQSPSRSPRCGHTTHDKRRRRRSKSRSREHHAPVLDLAGLRIGQPSRSERRLPGERSLGGSRR